MDNAFALVVVAAKNDSSSIYLARSKKLNTLDLVVAMEVTILWAFQVAELHKFPLIIESDAKVCIDVLSNVQLDFPWAIVSYYHDIIYFSRKFASCAFNWVRRGANSVAHNLAEYATLSKSFAFCNIDPLPPSVKEVCMRDVISLS
jgi:hypothetical protein